MAGLKHWRPMVVAILCCAGWAGPCFAADDHAKLAGDWQLTIPINGQPVNFIASYSGTDFSFTAVTPSGRTVVKKGTFSAQDGQYQEKNCTLGEPINGQYELVGDNGLRLSGPLGTAVWQRVPGSAAPTASSPAAASPAPALPTPALSTPALSTPAPSAAPVAAGAAGPTTAPSGPLATVQSNQRLMASASTPLLVADVTPDKLIQLETVNDLGMTPVLVPKGSDLFVRVRTVPGTNGRDQYVLVADHLVVRGQSVPLTAESRPLHADSRGQILRANFRASLVSTQAFQVPAPPDMRAPAAAPVAASPSAPSPTPPAANAPPVAPAAQASATPAPPAAEPAKPVIPWADPAAAADYATDGDDLWNVASNTLVAKQWASNARLVQDRPDLVLCGQHRSLISPNGFSSGLFQLISPGTPLSITPQTTSRSEWNGAVPMMATDLRRVVWIEKNDVWRGEYDWLHNAVINKKQVTTVGVINGRILLLTDNTLYLWSDLSKDKPLIRLDLLSGDTQQLQIPNFFSQESIASMTPDGLLYYADNELVHIFNPRSGKLGAVRNYITRTEGTHAWRSTLINAPDSSDAGESRHWLDADTVLTELHDARGAGVDGLATFSFKTGIATTIATSDPGHTISINHVLPGKDFVDILIHNGLYNHDGVVKADQPQRVLVSLKDGKQTPMNVPTDGTSVWIDDDRMAYGVTTGDLNMLGLYLFSRTSGTATRLCQRPAEFYPSDHKAAHLKQMDALVFSSRAGGGGLYRIKLDGTGLTPLDMKTIQKIDTDPVDLGLGVSPKPLWQPVTYTAEQLAVPMGKPNDDPNFPGDSLTVAAATQNMSPEDQAKAMEYYGAATSNAFIPLYYDPAKAALKVLAASQAGTVIRPDSMFNDVDLKDALFRPSVMRTTTDRATHVLQYDRLPQDKKDQIVSLTTKLFTDSFMAQPTLHASAVDELFNSSMSKARAQVLGTGSTASTPPPTGSSNQTGNNPIGNAIGGALRHHH